MTHEITTTEKINFYSSIYVEMVATGIKNKIDGLTSGRIALELLGCSSEIINVFEQSLINQLK